MGHSANEGMTHWELKTQRRTGRIRLARKRSQAAGLGEKPEWKVVLLLVSEEDGGFWFVLFMLLI